MVSYLTTLFLGKPPGGNFFFLIQRKREIIFPRKNVPDLRIDLGTPACKADKLPTKLPHLFLRVIKPQVCTLQIFSWRKETKNFCDSPKLMFIPSKFS